MTVYNIKQVLSHRDSIGYDGEMYGKDVFHASGLDKYLIKSPPKDKHEWKGEQGKGVDFVFKIGEQIIPVEFKWMTQEYDYRVRWFQEDVAARFDAIEGYTTKIVCTNRPENILNSEACQPFLGGYLFVTIYQLVQYLLGILSDYKNKSSIQYRENINRNNIENIESCVTYPTIIEELSSNIVYRTERGSGCSENLPEIYDGRVCG